MVEFIPNTATGDALRRYLDHGSDLSRLMEIDFFVAIPTEQLGNKFALEVKEMGFEIKVEQDPATGDWTCYCTKTLIPECSEIERIEGQLASISKPYGGYSDGFGSYGNAKE